MRLVKAAGRKAIAVPGDIRQKSFCQKLVDQTIQEFGKIDILVNNAAYQRTYAKLEDIPEDEFDTTYRTNVYGTFFLTQAALPKMGPGGAIINTCSIESYDPKNQLAPYASTKSALVSLTKSFAQFGMKQGVRINGVAPGPVWDATDSCDYAERTGRELRKEQRVREASAARRAGRSFLCFWRQTMRVMSPARFTGLRAARCRFRLSHSVVVFPLRPRESGAAGVWGLF